MPTIASAKKRAGQTITRNARNASRITGLKTAIKKVLAAIESKDVENAKIFLRDAESKIARAKGKHVVHANTAARTISRLAKRVATVAR
jgi:small subunit ribosomal protein S20